MDKIDRRGVGGGGGEVGSKNCILEDKSKYINNI